MQTNHFQQEGKRPTDISSKGLGWDRVATCPQVGKHTGKTVLAGKPAFKFSSMCDESQIVNYCTAPSFKSVSHMPKGGSCKQDEQPGQSSKISKRSNNRFWSLRQTIRSNHPNIMHIIQQPDYDVSTYLQNILLTSGTKFVRLVCFNLREQLYYQQASEPERERKRITWWYLWGHYSKCWNMEDTVPCRQATFNQLGQSSHKYIKS